MTRADVGRGAGGLLRRARASRHRRGRPRPASLLGRRRADRTPRPRRTWRVRQTLDDPAGHHDWVIEAIVDLDASDDVGEAVVLATALRRL